MLRQADGKMKGKIENVKQVKYDNWKMLHAKTTYFSKMNNALFEADKRYECDGLTYISSSTKEFLNDIDSTKN